MWDFSSYGKGPAFSERQDSKPRSRRHNQEWQGHHTVIKSDELMALGLTKAMVHANLLLNFDLPA